MTTANKLAATARELAGKGAARATRRDGRVPGVIYGDKAAPTLISLDPRDVMRDVIAQLKGEVTAEDLLGYDEEEENEEEEKKKVESPGEKAPSG